MYNWLINQQHFRSNFRIHLEAFWKTDKSNSINSCIKVPKAGLWARLSGVQLGSMWGEDQLGGLDLLEFQQGV